MDPGRRDIAWRVLVTRAEPEASRTAERLVEVGYRPFVVPLTRIVPADEPPTRVAADAILVTSRNGADRLADLPFARHVPVLAVGRRTAERAVALGFRAEDAGGDAAALARLATERLPGGARLLHVAGRDRKPEPAATLARAGFVIETWTAYAASAVTALPPALVDALEAGGVDAVLHYSRRSAAILVRAVRERQVEEAFARPCHVCLSADVAGALAPLPVRTATRPDEPALFDALGRAAEEFQAGSPPPQIGC